MAKKQTVSVYTCFKFTELITHICYLGLMLGSGLWLVDKTRDGTFIDDEDRTLIAMVYVCLVIVGFNLFYNTLLINARFFCKMKSVTFGLFIFDCLNVSCCYCILSKFCKGNNYIGFVIRQIAQAAIMIYTVTLV